MIDARTAQEFLSHERVAVIGASDEKSNFGATIYRELRDHGYAVTAVNPSASSVAGDPCYPDLASLPTPVDGAIVMVGKDRAVGVVQDCIAQGVPRVWLFRGIGGGGAVSDDAVRLCEEHGVPVVAGACPLMFLEPVGWFHKVHRGVRHLNGSLSRVAS